jgi:hypothetical protein
MKPFCIRLRSTALVAFSFTIPFWAAVPTHAADEWLEPTRIHEFVVGQPGSAYKDNSTAATSEGAGAIAVAAGGGTAELLKSEFHMLRQVSYRNIWEWAGPSAMPTVTGSFLTGAGSGMGHDGRSSNSNLWTYWGGGGPTGNYWCTQLPTLGRNWSWIPTGAPFYGPGAQSTVAGPVNHPVSPYTSTSVISDPVVFGLSADANLTPYTSPAPAQYPNVWTLNSIIGIMLGDPH